MGLDNNVGAHYIFEELYKYVAITGAMRVALTAWAADSRTETRHE